MKLLFVRHGDPDYEHDSLTERGRGAAQAWGDPDLRLPGSCAMK